jgi:hypothetical protein
MLSWTCRRFRARFTPGSAHPHRRACRECDAFAAAVERAAGTRLPLPAGLRRGLQEIATPAENIILPFPVPRLPLPGALAARLRAVGPPAPGLPAPPEWVRSPRYAVAASALLALLLGPLFMAAADRGLQAVRENVSPLLHRTGESGRDEMGRLRAGAASACGAARRSAAESLHRLDAGVSGLSAWLSTVATEESTHWDPRGEAAGSVRRP